VAVRAQVLKDTIKSAASAAMAKLPSSQHDDGSCDNLQIGVICTNKGVDVISRLPVKSKTAKMAMYSIPSECLGENDKYFVKCDKISCVAHYLKAWMTPGDHVDIPVEVVIPRYRSLSGGGGGSASSKKAYTRPTFTFPEGKCITDANGTKFLFKSGAFAKTDDEIAACIKDGTFRDNNDYLLSMKDAAWNEFKRQLKANNIKMSMLFECTGEFEEDGTEVVEPEAAIVFMDLLYPNLLPGHDVLVCLPPVKEGELVMEAAFNVRLSYPHFPGKIAIMGAQHNDMSTEGSEQEVEENFYIYSNMSIHCGMPNAETLTNIPILLHKADSFLPQTNTVTRRFPSDIVQAKYDAMIAKGENPDMEAWHGACGEFQGQCRKKLFEQLASDGATYGLNAFNKDEMFATNLIGMKIPKITTFITANHGPEQASAENVVARMKRKQAEASSSPPKRAAASPVEVSDVDTTPASEEVATQSQPSEVALSPSEAAEDALQKAFAKLLMKPNPGTEAMVAHLAKGMDINYIKNDNLTLHSVEFQVMTDEHKMQIALLIESLASK
jgi:hypothetical protein